ncbi:MAG: hypothetical protein ACRD0J_01770, partial [Acidimicrobiales bacterium]
ALEAPLAGSTAVLPGHPGATSYHGQVPAGTLAVSAAASSGWVLTGQGGTVVTGRSSFGFATAYHVDRAGPVTLSYHPPAGHWIALGVQGLLWALALSALVSGLGRSRPGRGPSRPDLRAGEPVVPILIAPTGDGGRVPSLTRPAPAWRPRPVGS